MTDIETETTQCSEKKRGRTEELTCLQREQTVQTRSCFWRRTSDPKLALAEEYTSEAGFGREEEDDRPWRWRSGSPQQWRKR